MVRMVRESRVVLSLHWIQQVPLDPPAQLGQKDRGFQLVLAILEILVYLQYLAVQLDLVDLLILVVRCFPLGREDQVDRMVQEIQYLLGFH